MIFRKTKEQEPPPTSYPENSLLLIGLPQTREATTVYETLKATATPFELFSAKDFVSGMESAQVIVTFFQPPAVLDVILDRVSHRRKTRHDGFPIMIVVTALDRLCELGLWLSTSASENRLEGIRLIVGEHLESLSQTILEKCAPILEPSVIKMPTSPEVECEEFKYFFAISPELRRVVQTMKELAENNIARIYLLGGPGSGKTSIAYYYFLCRGKGNFVTVNLNSESTGNKEAMKSLLCGHVTGAMGGIAAREGALSFSGDGVTFLDESHGVTGVVMQVLMEVLDSGQFLPLGATKKRGLDCAVIFASNRSWEALRSMMHLDEHARLGATIVKMTDLRTREEDMIAVISTSLAKFSQQCTSWIPPQGLSNAAWQTYKECSWHGNTRTLIRVTEGAEVTHALRRNPDILLSPEEIQGAINLWEPTEHESLKVYTSFETADLL